MKRSAALVLCVLISVAVATVIPVRAALSKTTGKSADPPSEGRLDALQSQVLDATRNSAEVAIDQTRRTAESAIEQTRKTAEQAVLAAQESNELIKTIFGWSAILFGAIVGVGAFIGFRELQGIRDAYRSRFKQQLDTFQTELSRTLADLNEKAAERSHEVTLMSIDIAFVVDDMSRLKAATDPAKTATDPATKQALSETILANLASIHERAQELQDSRTRGWVMCQRALACYYVAAYEEAFKWQQQASTPELNPKNWPDREQNLACYAAKIYEGNTQRRDMLERGRKILRSLTERNDLGLAEDLLGERDLDVIFRADPELVDLLRTLVCPLP